MHTSFHPPAFVVRQLVEMALIEDLMPLGDLSSSLLDPKKRIEARLVSREAGVVAGSLCVDETFAAVDDSLTAEWKRVDGDSVDVGETIAVVSGLYGKLLTAERTALNFLSHLSGIATTSAQWVDLVAGRAVVWDTRKTLPGYRSLQKAAVRAGGASNHRGNLSDWIMLKDNHLVGSSVAEGVAAAQSRWPGRTVHVEADTQGLAFQAVSAGADIILLDNFSPKELKSVVVAVRAHAESVGVPCPLLEASGGITFETVDAYADSGVDFISSGSLTNAVKVLDIGLDIM